MPDFAGMASAVSYGYMSRQDKIRDDNLWYDIEAQGGADPTGVVDATAIIQAAVNSFGAAGGTVFIPCGTFKVTSTITISNANVTVLGDNRVTSLIRMDTATGNVFTVSGIFTRFEKIRIQGLNSTLRTAGYAIEFTSTGTNGSCEEVDLIFMWSGVKMTGQLCRVNDMNIRETGANASGGQLILIDSFTDQAINAIVADNGSNPTGFAGVRITNLSSLIMTNCQIIHCSTGIDVVPTGTNTIPSLYCSNTFFDNGVIGANFVGAVGSTIARCKFLQCWFSSNSTAGIVINNANCRALDINGCDIYANPIGINALSAIDWAVRNSRIAANTTAGIQTTAASTHGFSIVDNVIGVTGGFGANANGINIQAGTYASYTIFDNRGLDTNTTKGITDLGVVVALTSQKVTSPNLGALLSGAMASIGANVVTVSNTTEQLILSCRIPANSVKIGDTFRFSLGGVSSVAGTSTVKIRVGTVGTVAGDAGQPWTGVAASPATTNYHVGAQGTLTIKSIGASGTCVAEGFGMANLTALNSGTGASATATINTTVDWFIDISFTAGTASVFTAVTGFIGPA